MNGTLINDLDICVDVINRILKKHDKEEISMQRYLDIFGFPVSEYYKNIGFDLVSPNMQELSDLFIGTYLKESSSFTLHEGVKDVLVKLQSKNIDQYILTAAHTDMANQLLGSYGISDLFKDIAGLDNHHAAGKIERGIELMKKNNIDPSKTVMFGDTIHDMEVAEKLGIDCILIGIGHQAEHRLVEACKDKSSASVISDFSKVLEVLQ